MERYLVRFPSPSLRVSAQKVLDANPEHFKPYYSENDHSLLIAYLSRQERDAAIKNGARVFRDFQLHPTIPSSDPFEFRGSHWDYWKSQTSSVTNFLAPTPPAAAPWQTATLKDVLNKIGAPNAWGKSRGAGVTLGIVDSGIYSDMLEFSPQQRSSYSKSFVYANPWADALGHGSMCACIAAGSDSSGGRYNGVAPDATLLSLRTDYTSADLYQLFDWILARKLNRNISGPVVLSNSYAYYECRAPEDAPEDHPFHGIVKSAVTGGIVVVFAAGNNHARLLCDHNPKKCSPDTIWSANSLDEVLSVGTVNWNNRMDSGIHGNSSRGPGQWSSQHKKPDCVAPTYGEVLWGSGYRVMEWWGSSGACPQVAGLAALLLGVNANLTPLEVGDIIRNSCAPIGLGPTCAGAGLINCGAALMQV